MTLLKATLIGVAIFAGVGTINAAIAADLGGSQQGSMKDEPVAVYGPNWAGLYVGGAVGYGWGNVTDKDTQTEVSEVRIGTDFSTDQRCVGQFSSGSPQRERTVPCPAGG